MTYTIPHYNTIPKLPYTTLLLNNIIMLRRVIGSFACFPAGCLVCLLHCWYFFFHASFILLNATMNENVLLYWTRLDSRGEYSTSRVFFGIRHGMSFISKSLASAPASQAISTGVVLGTSSPAGRCHAKTTHPSLAVRQQFVPALKVHKYYYELTEDFIAYTSTPLGLTKRLWEKCKKKTPEKQWKLCCCLQKNWQN